jgi:hypothetical protein
MRVAVGHGYPIVEAEQLVDGDRMIQSGPALGRIGCPAGDQKRSGRHERVKLHQIVSAFNQLFVRAGPGLSFGREFTKRACLLRIGQIAQWEAKNSARATGGLRCNPLGSDRAVSTTEMVPTTVSATQITRSFIILEIEMANSVYRTGGADYASIPTQVQIGFRSP